jgi:hypothetical protein
VIGRIVALVLVAAWAGPVGEANRMKILGMLKLPRETLPPATQR